MHRGKCAVPSKLSQLRVPEVQKLRFVVPVEDPQHFGKHECGIYRWAAREHPALSRVVNREGNVKQLASRESTARLGMRLLAD